MRLTGFPAIIAIAVYLTFIVWSVYLTVKIAEHVGAWPF